MAKQPGPLPGAKLLHWTEAQYWRSIVTGEVITAGQLIERGRPAVALIDLSFGTVIRDREGRTWERVRRPAEQPADGGSNG